MGKALSYAIAFTVVLVGASYASLQDPVGETPDSLRVAVSVASELEATASEEDASESDPRPGLSPAFFPAIFSTPETGIGGGGGFILTYRSPNAGPDSRPQSLGAVIFYTEKKQALLGISPEIYLDREAWRFQADIGYSKFPTSFFGIGNNRPDDAEEDYTLEGGSVDASLLRRVYAALHLGLRVDVKQTSVQAVEPGGLLDQGLAAGSDGGFYSGIGPSIEWDTRDNSFFPSQGDWLRLGATFYVDALGSDADYEIIVADLRHYRSIRSSDVLAVQILLASTSADTPFHDLAKLGDVMRGIFAGRVTDRALLAGQVEYRFPIKGRFGGVAFGSIGDVSNGLDRFRFANVKFTGGGGLRFALNKSEGINLRFDVGVSEFGSEIYFQFLEAF